MSRPRKLRTQAPVVAPLGGGVPPRVVSHCKSSALLLLMAWALIAGLLSAGAGGPPKVSFVTGAVDACSRALSSAHQSQPRTAVVRQARELTPMPPQAKGTPPFPRAPHPGRKKYEGISKRRYLDRLRHRRWAAQSKFPRIFGYVEEWSDEKGEGIILDQEKKQQYFVIRDEIGRCYHNFKTLQRAEMVEFFASDEVDDEMNLPLAKNISGPYGRYVKGSEEYRNRMLMHGTFPKRWEDTPDEYPKKVGEWWLQKRWRR
mmetsp:Transcript_37530/g.87182  ORF Transcript_37530/g.87182 Transcript_37530/m.87182 type:complete len:259 (+) Transcript_37530:68-844(+)